MMQFKHARGAATPASKSPAPTVSASQPCCWA